MFPHSVTLFTIGGIPIRIDPSWVLIAGLITWSLAFHYFPATSPNLNSAAYLAMAVAAMMAFFVSLLLHELAHATVAIRNGIAIRSITLFLLGGIADLEGDLSDPQVEMRVAIAGPAMSLLLALVFTLASHAAGGAYVSIVTSYLGLVNLVLAVFNILPAYPLDGGRVLRAWLWRRSGDVLSATRTAAVAGQVLALALMTFGALQLLFGSGLGPLWQILLGLFLLTAARAGYQNEVQRAAIAGITASVAMTSAPHTVAPGMTLSDVLSDVVLRYRVSLLPVVEDGELLGSIDEDLIAAIDPENRETTHVEDIFVDVGSQTTLTPDTPLSEVMNLIARTGKRKFIVVGQGRLAGVLTLADLTRYIALSQKFVDHLPNKANRRLKNTRRAVDRDALPNNRSSARRAVSSQLKRKLPPGMGIPAE